MELLPYEKLMERVVNHTLELVDSGVLTPIILIDGRAGSGKSTLAAKLQNELFKQGESMPRVIHMDDLYEGWQGLALGAEYLQRFVLQPLVSKKISSWQEYSWDEGKRERWREFSGGTPLIVEGCGALNQYTSTVANISIWLEVDEETRRTRWQEREGNTFDKYFDIWAAQELDFIASQKSPTLADFVLSSSAVQKPHSDTSDQTSGNK